MRIKVEYMASIPNDELINAGISLNDDEAIFNYFFDNGGEEVYHDYGLHIEVTDREINC